MSYEIRDYKLYLFDLDDTITQSISGEKFPKSVDDRKFMQGRRDRLFNLHRQGKLTAVVTNQGGAAWGFLDPKQMDRFLEKVIRNAKMDAYFVCYRDTGEKARASERTDKALTVPEYYKDFDRRKPGPGMLIEAMDHFSIDRHDTLMVGDREEDRGAAEAAGVSFEWAWDFF